MSNHDLLEAALVGYQAQLKTIDERILEIRSQIGGSARKATVVSDGAAAPKRHMSAAARKRIAAAQRERWKEYHKEHGAQAPAGRARGGKRRISAAGRKAIAEATKKRWAAYRAAKKKAA